MRQQRDYHKYELWDGHRLVYVGITNDPARRENEHTSYGKEFTQSKKVGRAVTKETARKWEKERLEQYRKTHGGDNPKYNYSDNG